MGRYVEMLKMTLWYYISGKEAPNYSRHLVISTLFPSAPLIPTQPSPNLISRRCGGIADR